MRISDDATQAWLDHLPSLNADKFDDGAELDGMSLCGLLVRRRPGRIGVLLEELLLEFDESDILDACELDPPCGLRDSVAINVRLWLRRGARLLDIYYTPGLKDTLINSTEPFAVAVRHDDVGSVDVPRYWQLEAEYLERHRLTPSRPG